MAKAIASTTAMVHCYGLEAGLACRGIRQNSLLLMLAHGILANPTTREPRFDSDLGQEAQREGIAGRMKVANVRQDLLHVAVVRNAVPHGQFGRHLIDRRRWDQPTSSRVKIEVAE